MTVTSSRREYEITLGGTVDMDNTLTRSYSGFEVAFQPNISLTIANAGNVPVDNPRVVTNDKRKWWSLEELLAEILRGAENDQEKALLIWDFVRKHRHHDNPLFTRDDPCPVRKMRQAKYKELPRSLLFSGRESAKLAGSRVVDVNQRKVRWVCGAVARAVDDRTHGLAS